MKSPRVPEPTRWRDRGADTHALESRAAVLADAASQVQPLAAAALSRIRNQVNARRARRGGVFGLHAAVSLRARVALAVGLLVACATTAGGARILWRKYVAAVRPAAPPPVLDVPAPRHVPRLPAQVAARTPVVEAPPPVIAAPPVVPGEAPIVRRARPAASAVVEAPPRESPAPVAPPADAPAPAPALPPAPAVASPTPARVSEGALVAEALFALRQHDDPRAALATLDRYARAYPHGVLETEALRTRVEAVVKLGDRKTALALLDGNSARGAALGDDLLLTRAELRAATGRFREALADFTQVLDSATGPLVDGGAERALYGRAVCLGRLAEPERARADLLAYQQQFPRGRFAVEVQRLLAGEPGPRP